MSTTTAPRRTNGADPERRPEPPRPRLPLAEREHDPTGRPSNPIILLSGPDFSHKTTEALLLTRSERLSPGWLLELGETDGNHYGAIPGVRYKLLEHDGTWPDIMETLDLVNAEAERRIAAGEKRPILIIDSMSELWAMLSTWAENRARNSTSNKKKLAANANDEVDIGPNYWNPATRRHGQFMSKLRAFPGVVVLTARGKWVSKIDRAGNPTKEREYTLEAWKLLGTRVSAWVRLSRDERPQLVGKRDPLAVGLHPFNEEQVEVLRDFSVERLLFDILNYEPDAVEPRRVTELVPGAEPDPTTDDVLPAVRPPAGAEATLIRRPSPRAVALFAKLDEIAKAKGATKVDLRPVWELIKQAAKDTHEITDDEANQLRDHYTKLGAKLPEAPPPAAEPDGSGGPDAAEGEAGRG